MFWLGFQILTLALIVYYVTLPTQYLFLSSYFYMIKALMCGSAICSQFVPTSLTLDSGVTRPPPLLSEADLLSCMDKVSANSVRILTFVFLVDLHTCLHKSCVLFLQSLISIFIQAGIGTDATMHEHIKKLLDRHYATKDSNTRFSPTNLVIPSLSFPHAASNYIHLKQNTNSCAMTCQIKIFHILNIL